MSRQQHLFGVDAHVCFYRTLLEQHPDGVMLVDSAGTTLYANPAWERFAGRPLADLTGRSLLEQVHPDDVMRVAAAVDAACSAGARARTIEYRCRRRDGGWQTVESICQPCPAGGEVLTALVSRDITERQAAQERREHARVLEATAQLSGEVAADFAELLLMLGRHADRLSVAGPDTSRTEVRALRRTLDRGRVLVDQLHTFALDDLDHRVAVDANEAIAEAARHLEQLAGPGVEVTYLLGAPAAVVGMSRSALEQVLSGFVIHSRGRLGQGGRLTIATSDRAEESGRAASPDGPHLDRLVIDLIVTGQRGAGTRETPLASAPPVPSHEEEDLESLTILVQRVGGEVLATPRDSGDAGVRIVLPLVPPQRFSA